MSLSPARRLKRSSALAIALACGALSIAASLIAPALWWVGLAALAGLLGVITWGVADVSSGVFLEGFSCGRRDAQEIALTFDDGPDPEFTPRVMELLAERRMRATFFVIGRRVRAHPELIARLLAGGHEVGVHTDEHPIDFPLRSRGAVRDDLARAIDALKAAGVQDPRWFRPPNGLLNPRIAIEATRLGLHLIGWSVRPRDGVATASEKILQRVASRLRGGDIVLLHDARSPYGRTSPPPVIAVLPRILDLIDARGLRAVTVSELLAASNGHTARSEQCPPRSGVVSS